VGTETKQRLRTLEKQKKITGVSLHIYFEFAREMMKLPNA
jgi:hypothetical protein